MQDRGLFFGRVDEVRRFSDASAQVRASAGGDGWPAVVLVHGLGGIGKSSLLHHLKQLREPNDAVAWIDFEDERKLRPAAFGGDNGPGLVTLLDSIMRACVEAMDQQGDRVPAEKALDDYRVAVTRLPQLLEQIRAGIAEAEQRGVTKEDVDALKATAVTMGALITQQPLTLPAAVGTAATVGRAAVARRGLWGRITGAPHVDPGQYDLLSDPSRALSWRLGRGMAALSEYRPLLVFLDTSEIVLTLMPWLREVMHASGGRVLWVVGARLEPEQTGDSGSEVAAFVRQVPNERLRLMAMTRFDDETIGEYLAIRLPAMAFDDEQVSRVSVFTKGLPLAVSLVAGLLANGATLDVACAEIDRPTDSLAPVTSGQVVSALARRFLVHVERLTDGQAQQDLQRILCLAVANGYPTRRPEVLRAMWNCEEDLYGQLQGLASRHDFVLSGSFRLHDDVRDTLRFDLMDPIRRTRVQPACGRALDALNIEIAQKRTLQGALQDQIASEEYLAALLDYVWYSFWKQPQAGWRAALTILPVLSLTHDAATDSLLSMLETFVRWGGPDDARRFRDLAQPTKPSFLDGWLSTRRGTPGAARLGILINQTSVDRLSGLDPIEGLLGSNADRQAALSVMQLQLALADDAINVHPSATIHALRQLATRSDPALAPAIARTLTSYASQCASYAIKCQDPGAPVPEFITMAQVLFAADEVDRQEAWNLAALAEKLHQKKGIEAENAAENLYRRALEADPNNAFVLCSFAFFTDVRGDHDAAENLCRRALLADPNHSKRQAAFVQAVRNLQQDDFGFAMANRWLNYDMRSFLGFMSSLSRNPPTEDGPEVLDWLSTRLFRTHTPESLVEVLAPYYCHTKNDLPLSFLPLRILFYIQTRGGNVSMADLRADFGSHFGIMPGDIRHAIQRLARVEAGCPRPLRLDIDAHGGGHVLLLNCGEVFVDHALCRPDFLAKLFDSHEYLHHRYGWLAAGRPEMPDSRLRLLKGAAVIDQLLLPALCKEHPYLERPRRLTSEEVTRLQSYDQMFRFRNERWFIGSLRSALEQFANRRGYLSDVSSTIERMYRCEAALNSIASAQRTSDAAG